MHNIVTKARGITSKNLGVVDNQVVGKKCLIAYMYCLSAVVLCLNLVSSFMSTTSWQCCCWIICLLETMWCFEISFMCCSSWSDMFTMHIDVVSVWATVDFFTVRVFIVIVMSALLACRVGLLLFLLVQSKSEFWVSFCVFAYCEKKLGYFECRNRFCSVCFFPSFFSFQTAWWQWSVAW